MKTQEPKYKKMMDGQTDKDKEQSKIRLLQIYNQQSLLKFKQKPIKNKIFSIALRTCAYVRTDKVSYRVSLLLKNMLS